METEVGFIERCAKCRGKGMRWFGHNTPPVPCMSCGGSGEKTFKACAEDRDRARVRAKERKAKKLKDAIAAFQVNYPDLWMWMTTADMEFAQKMHTALLKWGGLTENQLTASIRCSRHSYPKRCLI